MEVYDLTHLIMNKMPVYPGTKGPKISIEFEVLKDGFEENRLELYSHNGTHMDAPAHLIPGGKRLEDYDPSKFIGPGIVIDLSNLKEERITLQDFLQVAGDKFRKSTYDYLLLYTGWDKKWGKKSYFHEWPYLSEDLAGYLSTQKLKGIGIDFPSVDPSEDPKDDENLKAHKIILHEDIVIVENLKGLEDLLGRVFEFYGLPLHIKGAEGSPVRAIAVAQPEKGGD